MGRYSFSLKPHELLDLSVTVWYSKAAELGVAFKLTVLLGSGEMSFRPFCHLPTVMSGLIAFLQSELLSLSSEAKRKHPEIKEVWRTMQALNFLLNSGRILIQALPLDFGHV